MIKEKLEQIRKEKNAKDLKYQSLLEQEIKNIEKIARLQSKIIALQDINAKQKSELLTCKEENRFLKEKKK